MLVTGRKMEVAARVRSTRWSVRIHFPRQAAGREIVMRSCGEKMFQLLQDAEEASANMPRRL
jgi:hypothetical protein